jgi:hypothetical protein
MPLQDHTVRVPSLPSEKQARRQQHRALAKQRRRQLAKGLSTRHTDRVLTRTKSRIRRARKQEQLARRLGMLPKRPAGRRPGTTARRSARRARGPQARSDPSDLDQPPSIHVGRRGRRKGVA